MNKDKHVKAGASIVINTKYEKDYGHLHKLLIVGIYAPTDDTIDSDKEMFCEQLALQLESVGKKNKIILMGDFNTGVGREIQK